MVHVNSQDLFVVEQIMSLQQFFFQIRVESFPLDLVSRIRFNTFLSLSFQKIGLSWFKSISDFQLLSKGDVTEIPLLAPR